MRILKVRRGHATNSSSQHSIIVAGSFPQGEPWTPGGDGWGDEENHTLYYGGDWFLISSEKEKLEYFATQLKGILTYDCWRLPPGEKDKLRAQGLSDQDIFAKESEYMDKVEAEAVAIINDLFYGTGISQLDGNAHISGNAEWPHGLPQTFDGGNNLAFFREFAEAMARDKTLEVRGGCSDGGSPPENNFGVVHPSDNLRYSMLNSSLVAEKVLGIWRLYNRITGVKVHLDLRGDISHAESTPDFRPPGPELVDLKITDFCNMGCEFCYQDSTPGGQHARLRNMWTWMESCKEAGVLEVAIGGGEPTMHPEFVEILEHASKCFRAVNFSCRSLKWLDNPRIVNAVHENVRAIGVSIQSVIELEAARERLKAKGFESDKGHDCLVGHNPHLYERGPSSCVRQIVWHYIPDAFSFTTFKKILEKCEYWDTILMLGHKATGRAQKCKRRVGDKALRLVHERKEDPTRYWSVPSISVDTAFARRYKGTIEDCLGVSDALYYTQEGRFSMYYDAVNNRYGPSSYELELMRSAGGMIFRDLPCPVQDMFNRLPESG